MTTDYKHGNVTAEIISSAMEVHRALKNGFQERIYQRALEVELDIRQIKYSREVSVPVYYKDVKLGVRRVDLLVEPGICVELKAIIDLEDVHLAQALNYLEAFNLEIGLLNNFGAKSLQFKRLHNKKYKPH